MTELEMKQEVEDFSEELSDETLDRANEGAKFSGFLCR